MRSIKLTVALAVASAGCSAPFTYPDLAKAKDTYSHAVKTGDQSAFPKEYDDAKKSISAAQSAQDAQASFDYGKDPSRERDMAKEALYKAEVADGANAAAKAEADRRAKEWELAALQKEWDEKGALIKDAAARAEAERAAHEAEAARLRLMKFAEGRRTSAAPSSPSPAESPSDRQGGSPEGRHRPAEGRGRCAEGHPAHDPRRGPHRQYGQA